MVVRGAVKPNIFDYSDYRSFLRDWSDYLRKTTRGYSMRKVQASAKVPASTFPTILSGQMSMTDEKLGQFAPGLRLNREQVSYIKVLRNVEEASSPELREKAFRAMQRFLLNRGINLEENQTIKYMSEWYNVAIREMSFLPEFRPDPEWIQGQLLETVSLRDIKKSLQFLIESRLIDLSQENPDPSLGPMRYKGGFYQMAIIQNLKQFSKVGMGLVDQLPKDERLVRGYTTAMTDSEYREFRSILEKALKDVQGQKNLKKNLKKKKKKQEDQRVYHLSLGLVPVTKKRAG